MFSVGSAIPVGHIVGQDDDPRRPPVGEDWLVGDHVAVPRRPRLHPAVTQGVPDAALLVPQVPGAIFNGSFGSF